MKHDLTSLNGKDLRMMPDSVFKSLAAQVVEVQKRDRMENQLLYYKPVSEKARAFHYLKDKYVGLGGGNGSSKTDTILAHLSMVATGIRPMALKDLPRTTWRGPVSVRVVCESLTTVLVPILLPKLQYWKWNGVDEPGGDKGHFGWIPKTSLRNGSWDKSWSEKTRMLTVLYRDPDYPDEVVGESTFQFMSYDQDPTDFASGDFHYVLHDEPPTYAIWRENQARTMRVDGRMLLAMTWPDDPAIPVDWIFDELYDKAEKKEPGFHWINLYSTENPNLRQDAVAFQAKSWSDETRRVRIFGEPIRFSNRIHPNFTDVDHTWCFVCNREISPMDGHCGHCGGTDFEVFNHVDPNIHPSSSWPTIMLLDPHPRKPHMWLWVQVDPKDDIFVIAEGECSEDPTVVNNLVTDFETQESLSIAERLIDPNMGMTPSGTNRRITWKDEFEAAGLRFNLAEDSEIGRKRLNEYLKPDRSTRMPRVKFAPRCTQAIHQMKRYIWDDHKKNLDKDQKQQPKDKNSDYPTLLKYLMNYGPEFNVLKRGFPVLHTRSKNGQASNHRKRPNR